MPHREKRTVSKVNSRSFISMSRIGGPATRKQPRRRKSPRQVRFSEPSETSTVSSIVSFRNSREWENHILRKNATRQARFSPICVNSTMLCPDRVNPGTIRANHEEANQLRRRQEEVRARFRLASIGLSLIRQMPRPVRNRLNVPFRVDGGERQLSLRK